MIINHNLMAMNTNRQLGVNNSNMGKSIEKLSSGLRINRAGDDAAGLAISEKMRGQIRGLDQASRNSQDGISMIQTAEGALQETQSILQRMRELAVQSSNDTNTDSDRTEIQEEINQLTKEITRISDTTEFNTQNLLGGKAKDVSFQIGANQGQNLKLSINDMSSNGLDVLSETIEAGKKGSAVERVKAEDEFGLDGVKLTATAGDKIEAKMSSKIAIEKDKAGETTHGFARGITGISAAAGVTESAAFKIDAGKTADFVGNGITLTAKAGEFNWAKVDGTAAATISIEKSGDKFKVSIGAKDDTQTLAVVDEFAMADANGDLKYDAHGVSFSMKADQFANVKDGEKIDINLITATGISAADKDITTGTIGTIGTKTSYTTNTKTSAPTELSDAKFKDDKIEVNYANLLEGAASVKIEGTGLDANAGSYKVTILDAADKALSTDTFTFADKADAAKFVYNNHGIKFEINQTDADNLVMTQKIEKFDDKVTIGAAPDPFKFDITDSAGNTKSVVVNLEQGDFSSQEIVDKINVAAKKANGGVAFDVASMVDGKLTLQAGSAGKDSMVKVTNSGGLSSLFDTNAEQKGSDSSVTLKLEDKTGATIDSTKTIKATDKEVVFTDANGKKMTVELNGVEGLSKDEIEEKFTASDITKEVSGIDVSSSKAADKAITVINDAIETVSAERSKLGAVQNRLEHTINNLNTSSENLTSAESRIRDVDMAKEMMEQSKNSILSQAAQAMLAQAKQAPQGVLQLLR